MALRTPNIIYIQIFITMKKKGVKLTNSPILKMAKQIAKELKEREENEKKKDKL